MLLIIAILGTALIYTPGSPLCIGCPNSVGFNPNASKHTFNVQTLSSGLSTSTIPAVAPGTAYGSVSWPIANSAATFTVSGPWPYGQIGSWLLLMPSTDPPSCYNGGTASPSCYSSSYVFAASTSSPAVINNGNNPALYSAESSYLPSNPYTFTSNYTSTNGAAAGCSGANVVLSTVTQCTVRWTITRYYFTVNMQTQGATISINCTPGSTCASSCSIFNCGFASNANYVTAFQSGVTGALNSAINPDAALVAPTQLDFQLNLPANLAGQSNLDSAGVIAAWTLPACQGAGQSGTPVGDLCETNCGGVSGGYGLCSITEANPNTALSLYSDAAQSNLYGVNFGAQTNVNGYTAAQLAALKIYPSVYTGIHINNFGAQYQMNSGCFVNNYAGCFAVSSPQATLTVGFDVLTTTHTITTYPVPAPFTGTNAGGIDGQVVDGSLFWHPGVAGASLCFTDITGCAAVNGNGVFNFTNIAAGTHTVQITAPGFFPQTFTVNVGTGIIAHQGQVAIAESNPWYLAQLCFASPLQNPLNPAGNQFCIPYVVIGATFATVTILGVAFFKYRQVKIKL